MDELFQHSSRGWKVSGRVQLNKASQEKAQPRRNMEGLLLRREPSCLSEVGG